MSLELTKKENAWIRRFKKVCDDAPSELRFYVIDGDCIAICKAGVSCNDFTGHVDLNIGSTNMLPDVHE